MSFEFWVFFWGGRGAKISPQEKMFEKTQTARIPLVTKVVSVSVHGYFAQSNALGKPDSGGQIVYVLDAVRALEKELNQRLEAALGPPPGGDPSAGAGAVPGQPPRHPRAKVLILTRLIPEALDTSCDARLERVAGTEAAAILRVPFRAVATASPESGGSGGSAKALRKFVSRFQVWPFLEDFALDSFGEILRELGGSSPDLILGNYSDGNLVATLLSRRFSDGGGASGGGDGGPSQPSRRRRRRHGPTQCSIAHALEPNKYRDSQARWNSRDYAGFNFETMFTSVSFVFEVERSRGRRKKRKTHVLIFLSPPSPLKRYTRQPGSDLRDPRRFHRN